MCLAVPAKVTEIDREGFGVTARVDVLGVTRKISLDLVPHAEIDDWVLVHAGAAIEVIDEQYAAETIELLRSVPYLQEDENIFGEAPADLRDDLVDGEAPVDAVMRSEAGDGAASASADAPASSTSASSAASATTSGESEL